MTRIPIGISNRHIHLSQQDAEKLFGKDFELTKLKDLSQPWQFAAEECVRIKWPKGQIDNVRILWPRRKQTQVEIMRSDTFTLGVKAPIRLSGDIKGSAGIEVTGPQWSITLQEWVIVAKRHLHITIAEAEHWGLKDGQTIKVRVGDTERGLVFDNVIVRARDDFALDCHIDMDEGNAAGLGQGARGEIVEHI